MGLSLLLLPIAFLASCIGGEEKPSPLTPVDIGHGDEDTSNVQDVDEDVDVDAGADANFEVGSYQIQDHYVSLPFCSDRNLFIIKDQKGIGFCGKNPVVLYAFDISSEVAVSAEPLVTLPERMGGREVWPVRIRDIGADKILMPMISPNLAQETAATFLIYDLGTRGFVGPVVNASAMQIGTHFQEDTIPIAGLFDLARIGDEFWGVLSNPNADGTFRFGFGIALPQTEAGLVDAGVAPNENGLVEKILSNRTGGSHFSFRMTDKKPTNVESLGDGLVVIQNSGTPDSPASIDIASHATHQLLPGRNIPLGSRELAVLPRLALDVAAMKMYPATSQNLLEVDLREEAQREIENEIALSSHLGSEISSVILVGGQLIVGDRSGNVLFIGIRGGRPFDVQQAYDLGEGVSDIQIDAQRNLYFALEGVIVRLVPN